MMSGVKILFFIPKKNILNNQDISLVTCRHKIVDETLGNIYS